MIIYFILIAVLCVQYSIMIDKHGTMNLESYYNKKYAWFAFIALLLIFALRDVSVGCDMQQYLYEYENANAIYQHSIYERGFYYFNYLMHDVLGVSWQWYVAFVSIILLAPLCIYISRKSLNPYYSVFLFITIGNFTMYLSGLRQSMAISLCILSMCILENRNIKGIVRISLSVLMVGIAYSLHNSAVIFVVYFVLKFFKVALSKKTLIVLFVVAVLSIFYGGPLLILLSPLFPDKYQTVDVISKFSLNPLLIVISALIIVFSLLFLPVDNDNTYGEDNSVLVLFSILNLLFACLSYQNGQLGRLQYYFNIANIILIPNTLQTMTSKNRALFRLAISVCCILYFYISSTGGVLHIDEYMFFWRT